MNVLVTGSQGYLGSVLTDVLAKAGYHCIGLDTGFFKDSLLYPPPLTKTIHRDAREITERDLAGIDVVVHLAGISNDPISTLDVKKVYDPTRTYSLQIARMCKKLNIKFVFASSCSVYGVGEDDLLDENSPVQPQTGYSLNKLQIESDLKELASDGFDPIALRFATVFGLSPRIRFDVVINMFVGMAHTSGRIILNSDGQAWRPNLHILDLCQAVIEVIEFDNTGRGLEVLNIGSEENNIRIIDLAKAVQRSVPGSEISFLAENPNLDMDGLIKDRKVRDGVRDARTYKVSFNKIKSLLPRFRCVWSVEQGIIQLIEGFRDVALDYAKFNERGFYRLQQLEYLYEHKLITDDFSWM